MAEQDTGKAPDSKAVSTEEYNAAIEKTRRLEAELVDSKKTLSRYSTLGDPDDIRGKLEDYTIIKRETAGGDPKKIEEIIAREKGEIERAYSKKLSDLETENKTTVSKLKKLQVINPAVQAAAEVFNSDALPLFTGIFEQSLDVDDSGNVFVKDSDGKARRSEKDPRQNMALGEFLQELASKYPSAAKATGNPGVKPAGDKSAAVGTSGLDAKAYLAMTPQERAKLPAAVRQQLASQIFNIPGRAPAQASK